LTACVETPTPLPTCDAGTAGHADLYTNAHAADHGDANGKRLACGSALIPAKKSPQLALQLPVGQLVSLPKRSPEQRILVDLVLTGIAVRGRAIDLIADQLHEGDHS
jgi:hypothetical protein